MTDSIEIDLYILKFQYIKKEEKEERKTSEFHHFVADLGGKKILLLSKECTGFAISFVCCCSKTLTRGISKVSSKLKK